MKIKFLITTGLFSLVSVTAVFAQKGTLNDALEAFNKYDGLKGSMKIALPSLTEAKTNIDKAAANDKTATLPLTYAVKGAVYSALALNDTVTSTSTPLFITADEALKKAKETDTKGENKKLIDNSYRNLAQIKYTKGIKDFNKHNFAGAYEAFDYYRMVLPDDTNSVYYTGLAAANAKKYPEAIANYTKLLTLPKYSNGASIYNDLITINIYNKDTTNAIKVATEAVDKYPTNANLRNREIQLYLQTGRIKEVSSKLDKAIEVDPKNKSLYYYSGFIAMQAKNYDKAIELFNKAIALDPQYFEPNLGAGYCYLNPGIDLFNKANNMPISKTNPKASQVQYDALSKQANDLFDKAKPFLEKATQIDPKSEDALTALKKVYLGKKDNVNANLIQKKIEALK
jgi:tetratricopeptide (TPR) repeat protein